MNNASDKITRCNTEQESWSCPNMLETWSDFHCEYYKCKICDRRMTLYYDDMR